MPNKLDEWKEPLVNKWQKNKIRKLFQLVTLQFNWESNIVIEIEEFRTMNRHKEKPMYLLEEGFSSFTNSTICTRWTTLYTRKHHAYTMQCITRISLSASNFGMKRMNEHTDSHKAKTQMLQISNQVHLKIKFKYVLNQERLLEGLALKLQYMSCQSTQMGR
ncbi:hypothetical protein SAY87_009608 [Trapa incisa]|uniref:Uncharacterized protein n=1 Tax=Trapa incisa TaxID=236973 RepID=A0AAN7PXW6_9MYRT|nr:hypothetical protein SAY87_009608 [Trapa incisa]